LLIHFLAKKEFWAKLEEVKSLLSNKIPGGTFEEVFEVLMNEFIDRHSPEKRTQRREKRKARSVQSPNKSQETQETTSPQKDSHKSTSPKPTRHIPIALRDKVFARDNARCTYVGQNGKRCGSTHSLQIDHIKPFARGEQNTLSNLRLLCGKHNRHEAKRILGANVMNQFDRRE
jgi:5-methylcytosine-specific restriction endonuclease McrA